jgi:hypothetical protein
VGAVLVLLVALVPHGVYFFLVPVIVAGACRRRRAWLLGFLTGLSAGMVLIVVLLGLLELVFGLLGMK